MGCSLYLKTTSYDISLRQVCKEDIARLAEQLRPSDKQELWAAYRCSAPEILAQCLAKSSMAVSFWYRESLGAMAGVAPESILGQSANVWLWTGTVIDHCPLSFWRASRLVLQEFLRIYPRLYAICDRRYYQANQYIRRLGGGPQGAPIILAGAETQFQLYCFNQSNKEEKWEE